jgi:uncharacterized repeat protein (TIGR01451 family)
VTQRRLFIGAIALTIAMGGFLFVATGGSLINADEQSSAFNPDNCATPSVAKKNKKCANDRRIIAVAFSDANGNGTQDDGEAAASGVGITIKKGSAVVEKETGDDGRARFNDLNTGSYSVTAAAAEGDEIISKNPQTAKVVKGKIAFATFAVKQADGGNTDPSPSPTASNDPGETQASAYRFVSLPISANKNYGKDNADLNPVENSVLQLANLPDLTGKANQFKSILADISGAKDVRWDAYSLNHGASVPGQTAKTAAIQGKDGGNITDKYVVSDCIAADDEVPMKWENFGFTMKAKSNATLRVYYRVMDSCPTDDMAGGEWTRLDISNGFTGAGFSGLNIGSNVGSAIFTPPVDNSSSQASRGGITDLLGNFQYKAKNYKTAINKNGKFFQYKINIKGKTTQIHTISLNAEPVGGGSTSTPKPTPSASTTATATPSSGPAGEGKILIQTRYLVDEASDAATSPTPSGGPILPTGSPKSSPTATASANANTVNPLCYGDQNIESAANVALPLIKASKADGIKIEDEETDDDGEWTGLNGEEDSFPADTYSVTFGDYDATTYKLVAFCDPDNDHLIRSQSDPKTKKATFSVKNGQKSTVIALYAKRTMPYISMNKYAVPGDIVSGVATKILRIVYPGQKFNYLIRYTNTGGEAAKDLVIRDVIPAEFDVDPTQGDTPDSKLKFAPDPRGGTLVTATLGNLAAGATGTLQIKVTLKSDAFDETSTDSGGILAPE